MGNSTTSLQYVFDIIAAKGIPDPRRSASGYGTKLALRIANDVMADIIAERFNWKWNRKAAAAFLTNSFQQDYPQLGLRDVGWMEDADRVDINNPAMPKPLKQLTVRRQLSTSGLAWSPVTEICWMYNYQLNYGSWPGAGATFHPLLTAQVKQNPIMSMVDANGNLLIVTGFGITGNSAPLLPAQSQEGTTVADGTVTWTVVDPMSQGFRVAPLPGAAGPIWQIIPYYQMKAPQFAAIDDSTLINPIPDDSSRFFLAGVEAYCLEASLNPGDVERSRESKIKWLQSMVEVRKQGDRENDAYAMLPATSPIENVYAWVRNPQDPSQPY